MYYFSISEAEDNHSNNTIKVNDLEAERQMQGPAHEEEQPHASVQAWGGPPGEQLCEEGPGCPSGRQVNHEPAVCPGCQEGQWDPRMH